METQNEIVQRYVYGGRNKVASSIAVNNQSTSLQCHADRLGSTTFLTDSTGQIQAVAQYDEWGNRGKSSAFKFDGNNFDLAHNYTGHNYDSILGQYHAKARMYDAGSRRFAAEDLIKGETNSPITLNPYTYTIDNPLKYIDPTGLYFITQDFKYYMPSGSRGITSIERVFLNNFTVVPDNNMNQAARAVTGRVPFIGDWLSSDLYVGLGISGSSSDLNLMLHHAMNGTVLRQAVGGPSFRESNLLDSVTYQLRDNAKSAVIEQLDREIIGRLLGSAANLNKFAKIGAGALSLLDGMNLVEQGNVLFNIINLSNIATEFNSQEAAQTTMNSLKFLVSALPEYFIDRNMQVSPWGHSQTAFCIDLRIFNSGNSQREIDRIVRDYGNRHHGFIPSRQKEAARENLEKWLVGYRDRLGIVSDLANSLVIG